MSEQDKPYIGGQAVIEGVMMRSPRCLSIAVRRPDGTIAVREGPLSSRVQARVWKLPGLRGVATLVESLSLGYRALRFSAEQQMSKEEREREKGGGSLSIFLSTAIALGLFIGLPQLLASGTGRLFGLDLGLQDWRFHVIIGGFKLLVLVGYLYLISRVAEVRRVFQYHGAEHKTINAYEAGLPLTVENVRAQTTLHPRCGTTFLVIVIIISIIAGSIASPLVLPNAEGILGNIAVFGLRVALLPFVAALSYELQRLTARYCTTGLMRAVLWPGFLFQKITTREPDDRQIEIAIAAMQTAEWREKVGVEVPAGEEPLVFPSFEGFVEALPELRPALASAAE